MAEERLSRVPLFQRMIHSGFQCLGNQKIGLHGHGHGKRLSSIQALRRSVFGASMRRAGPP